MVTFISNHDGEPLRPARKSNPRPQRTPARNQKNEPESSPDAPEPKRAPRPGPRTEQKRTEQKRPEQARTEKKPPEQPRSGQPDAESPTAEPKRRPRRRGGRGRKKPAASSEATSTPNDSPRETAPAKDTTPPTKKSAWNPAEHIVEPVEGKTRFQDLEIPESILHAISDLGWQYCTPIQASILPHALQHRDCTGKAQT
ncbi:MAG: hypothetical protein PHG65_13040, partial [Kiritimatiellae bacterium]|nr:hypothetical protein [Kiritimatiellia bacterium]